MTNEEIGEEIRSILHAIDTFLPGCQYGPPDCAPGTEKKTIDHLLAELGGWMNILKDRIDYDPYNPARCHRTPPREQ